MEKFVAGLDSSIILGGKNALRFWQENKDGLIALARAHAKRAAEAKSKVQ